MADLNTPLVPAAFFEARGLIQVFRNFLGPEDIAALSTSMRNSPARPAAIYKEEDSNRNWRKTRDVQVPAEIRDALVLRLLELVPELNRRYATQAHAIQLLQFLLYEQGDYFAPHVDWHDNHDYGIPTRLISFVLFLNVSGPDTYQGGELVLYVPRPGLVQTAVTVAQLGLGLQPEAGMLITFDPHLMHEVKAVYGGQRLTVAGWFC